MCYAPDGLFWLNLYVQTCITKWLKVPDALKLRKRKKNEKYISFFLSPICIHSINDANRKIPFKTSVYLFHILHLLSSLSSYILARPHIYFILLISINKETMGDLKDFFSESLWFETLTWNRALEKVALERKSRRAHSGLTGGHCKNATSIN